VTFDPGRIRHLVLDMDGTVYCGSTLFDCTLPFLGLLKDLGIGYTFITNNSSRGIQDYVDKLKHLGIPASRDQIYTSTDAVIEYLRAHLPAVRKLWLLGTPSMARHLEDAGFVLGDGDPEAVVIGYDNLCRTAWWIRQDLPYIASHPDRVCPTDQPTVLVDCGAFSACLTAATGRSPIVLGKPDPRMLDGVCRRHGLRPEQLAVVGDRLYTDMLMAQRAGAASVLVLTGEATAGEAATLDPPPDLVVRDVGALGEILASR
jgi:NagD protein